MKIAIHHRPGSFSDRWIEYCKKENIDFKIVNAYASDIVEQVADCDAFMWHHHQGDYRDNLFAKQLIYSLETKGIRCFPDFHTTWHFDDKVGQKYLLESVGAPLVPSYVFYTKKDAFAWIDKAVFPKVFKLRGGAGATNVRLAHSKDEAKILANKAFGKGFPVKKADMKERWRKYREGKAPLSHVIKGLGRFILAKDFAKMHSPEKGYVYFQDFIPNNQYDIRIIVIGNRAFAIKRMMREDDLRDFGSGYVLYNKEEIPETCVKASFEVAKQLESQSIVFDYVFENNNNPTIVEISYGFATHGYNPSLGYWTDNLAWHEGAFNPQEWMVQDQISEVRGVLIDECLTNIFTSLGVKTSTKHFDLRVVVIGGEYAMGEKRICREGDFRASGSGQFEYVPIRQDVLQIAFNTANILQMQSVAFDFIFKDNEPLIVEMSYGFGTHGISKCPGYYTSDYRWHEEESPNFYSWMVENLVRTLK